MDVPKWMTPGRAARLVQISRETPTPDRGRRVEAIVRDWIAEDKSQAASEREDEKRRLHRDGPYKGYGKPFDVLAQELYRLARPPYYEVGEYPDPFTYERTRAVRVPGTGIVLHAKVGRQPTSKNGRRKAERYRQEQSDERILLNAVKRFWGQQ